MKKVNKQCLLDSDTPPHSKSQWKNLVLASVLLPSNSSNQQTLFFKKKISVESVKTRFQ